MMSLYLPDEIEITPVTRNATFRTETEGTPFTVNAYVEDDDKIQYGSDGAPIKPAKRIFLPYGTVITEGDSIRVTKRSGSTVTDVKQRVRSVSPVGSFGRSHLEIIV